MHGDAGPAPRRSRWGDAAWRPLWKAVWQFLKVTAPQLPGFPSRNENELTRNRCSLTLLSHQDPETPAVSRHALAHPWPTWGPPALVTRVSENTGRAKQPPHRRAERRPQPTSPQGGPWAGDQEHSEPSVLRAPLPTRTTGQGLGGWWTQGFIRLRVWRWVPPMELSAVKPIDTLRPAVPGWMNRDPMRGRSGPLPSAGLPRVV